jgi:hypothetical protein
MTAASIQSFKNVASGFFRRQNKKGHLLERISIKRETIAVGDNVGTRPGACPMSAANKRSNLFNFEFNYPFERHSPLWAGTRPAPTFCVSFY